MWEGRQREKGRIDGGRREVSGFKERGGMVCFNAKKAPRMIKEQIMRGKTKRCEEE